MPQNIKKTKKNKRNTCFNTPSTCFNKPNTRFIVGFLKMFEWKVKGIGNWENKRRKHNLSGSKQTNIISRLRLCEKYCDIRFSVVILWFSKDFFFYVGPRKESIFFDHLLWSIFQLSLHIYRRFSCRCRVGLS